MSAPFVRRVVLSAVLGLLAFGGMGAAYLLRGRRDVTTTSAEAYRLYRLGRENELKLYRKEAISAYAGALEHDPHFVMATVRLADQLYGRDPDRARSLLQCAGRFVDDVTPREKLIFRAAQARMTTNGDRKKLAEIFEEYARRFPDDPESYRFKAAILFKESKPDLAAKEYQHILELDPNDASAYNVLGYIWLGRGDYARSEDSFKRYRFLAPDQANPHDSLGELYANTGRYDEAEESLKKALAIKPDFVASIGHLGTVETGRGNHAKAAEYFDRAADTTEEPRGRFQFRSAAMFSLIAARDMAGAGVALERLEQDFKAVNGPERSNMEVVLALHRALVQLRSGRLDEAEATVMGARSLAGALKPESAKELNRDVTAIQAELSDARGQWKEAADGYRDALKDHRYSVGDDLPYLDPYNSIRVDYSRCLARLGRIAEAEEVLQPILSRNPKFQPAVAAFEEARAAGRASAENHAGGR